MWTVRVQGLPAPKGSMKCVGGRGKVKHQLIADNEAAAKPWRDRVEFAGQQMLTAIGEPLDGPLTVEICFTVPKPPSVPVSRLWPITRSAGDVDKLARLVLDALDASGLFHDDSQVVELTLRKAYPHTPAPDLVADCGALIRIGRTEL